ncbi:TIGR04222 domain-containing membrane protein [Streptomyces griseus]|uniref:TIGR04222 domain-containing membrane protein n=1 Tax=Streptomyces griseus TaxID=1911 RepID=UPI0004C6AA87|nr:TIGR04222 domain-containing membrane protein [Streptomyces griseus]
MDLLLVLFYAAGAAAVVRLVVLARRTRGGPGGPLQDVYEAAFLAGGPGRVADTAFAAMHLDGRLVIGGPGVVAVVHRTAHDPVERAVLDVHAAAPSGALHQLRLGVMTHPAVQEIGDGLAARGLLTAPGPRRALRRWCVGVAVAAFLVLPTASVVITIVQFGEPGGLGVPFVVKVLPLFFVCFATALVYGAASGRRVSPSGVAALAAYRREHAYGTGGDVRTAVAVTGIRALPDRELWERLRNAARLQGQSPAGPRRTAPPRPHHPSSSSSDTSAAAAVVLWCAGADAGGGGDWGPGGGGGSSCGSSGSSCGSSGSSCGSSSPSCGSSSSSCGSSSSSCGSSSGSSCGSSG